jgi:alpha-mannosidase
MHYLKERATTICNELDKLCRRNTRDIDGFVYKQGFFITPQEAAAASPPFLPFENSATWGEADRHAWFSAEFVVPQDMNGKQLMFSFTTQGQGWDVMNPQFLLFLDGQPAQGLDVNHTEVLVTARAEAGRKYVVDLQGYSGVDKPFGLQAKYFEFMPEIYGLKTDIESAVYTLEKQDDNTPAYYRLENTINDIINRIDLRDPESAAFLDSVTEARMYANHALFGAPSEITATAIGATHIDVAWWWTVEQTREKAARSFATAVKLIEEYGAEDFKFQSSQPQLYKFVKERYPDLYEKIRRLVAEGKWEAEGGMWLEADCNLTSGESLVRQFLHGKNFFKNEFGVESELLWLPDVFGYSAALPQIMKKSGIKYFMTTKISWNQFNKLPYDTFMWRGIDGTEIFTHLITTPSPYQDVKKEHNTTYNGDLHPGAVIGAWNRYQQKAVNNDVLIAFGYGDGGGGCTRRMIELGARLKKGLPGAPIVRFEKPHTYITELEKRVAGNKYLPKWVGELYLEYHRGTYTSMARNKRSNRKLEFLLGELEFISVWAEKYGAAYPQQALLDMWEIMLRNQFHDILPGSSIKEVYEVTKREYEAIASGAERLFNARAAVVLPKAGNALTVLNTLHVNRNDICVFDAADATALINGDAVLPVQKTHDGKAIAFVRDVPAKGYKLFQYTNAADDFENPFEIRPDGITTPFLKVSWDGYGFFTSVYDIASGRETLTQNGRGNRLAVYEDKPMNYDNWDIDIYYTEKSWLVDAPTEMRWLERGPVRATLFVRRAFLQSVIEQKVHFYADIPRVDFETYADWKQHQCLLKTEFDINVNASEATYDIQFGNVKRPTHFNTGWDFARFEVCGHKYADVSEGAFGVALLNDCKYGYGIHDSKMTLSLIKSGIVPNPEADQEEHFFTYSLMPHIGGFADSSVPEQAYMLNVPLRTATGSRDAETGEHEAGFVSVDADNIALETIKKSYDGTKTVIRLHEYRNEQREVTLSFGTDVTEVYEADLMENELTRLPLFGNEVSVPVKPFEIKTFVVK